MLPVLSAQQMQLLDKYTIETLGLDGKLLMSNAAREVLRVLRTCMPEASRPLILAGTGNNGGDGIAFAYYAQQEGMTPTILLCHPEITNPPTLSLDSTYFYRIAERALVNVEFLRSPVRLPEVITRTNCDVVIDAIFGTGLSGNVGDYYLQLIDRLNHTSRPIISVDCPSGLNCSSGEVSAEAVEADVTVSMGYPKRGFFHPHAWKYVGELYIASLGFANLSEAQVDPAAYACGSMLWEPLLGAREPTTHKGDYGKLLVVAGSLHYPGAARMAAQGALRAGAGLIRLVVPEPIYSVSCDDPAIMVSPHSTDGEGGFAAEPDEHLSTYLQEANALLIGPGMGDGAAATQLVRRLLSERDLPVVIDADGLRALPLGVDHSWPVVITPHVGELARLAGMIPLDVLDRWFDVTAEVAADFDVMVLAKSNQCVLCAPNGTLWFPRSGHPALAVGGTGDVLSGIIGALLARAHVVERRSTLGFDPGGEGRRRLTAEIVVSAVNIQSAAAHIGAEEIGDDSFTPGDLIELIPQALAQLRGGLD